MSAAAAERVRSAREVKCATHSSPQQLARGALLSALRPRTLRAPTLFYVPAVLSLAPALRLGGGHFGAGSARSGNKPNPGARAHAGMLHPCASRAPTSQKVDDKSHSRAMCVLVPQAKGGVQKCPNFRCSMNNFSALLVRSFRTGLATPRDRPATAPMLEAGLAAFSPPPSHPTFFRMLIVLTAHHFHASNSPCVRRTVDFTA
jgi:hypothetical protein